MSSLAFTTTKWMLNLASRMTKADVRLHNGHVIEDDMAIIFTVNHFTRLETILLPYEIHKFTGKEVWSLAAGDLFTGKIGEFLRKMGTVSTKDPDRDRLIVNSLLEGKHPWIIFPEGQMIKDKKVIDPAGMFSVFNRGERRPPHKGAANLALRAEFYRHKIECVYNSPHQNDLPAIMQTFGLDSVEEVVNKRTVIIPVNITYFPIRARDNAVLRMASALTKDLSERALEELSVEGTLLSEDTDIDVTFCEPIDVREYLHREEYAELMACGDDLHKLEADPKSLFNEAASELLPRYMTAIYKEVRVNYDHIFATLIRYQGAQPFTERRYRNRIFLCAHEILEHGRYHVHSLVQKTYRDVLYEDPSPKFDDFLKLCMQEGVVERHGREFRRTSESELGKGDFHVVRRRETTFVIANEVEPLDGFREMVQRIATSPREELSKRIRDLFLEEDRLLFEEEYAEFKNADSHPPEVGRPFLIVPDNYVGGVVLAHGYMAAPLEVRKFAEFLAAQGYAVYGVRLRGHGTAPEDLSHRTWADWYESLNRGYVVIKSLTDRIVLGGFSTGGTLALYGAGLKRDKIEAVFSINAPYKLRSLSARLVPSVVGVNSLLKRIRGPQAGWDFVQNSPENKHINYSRNPLSGVSELSQLIDHTEKVVADIIVPTLIMQGSKDPLVDPSSGPELFNRVGTTLKELTILERTNHGIVNGAGAEDVYERVHRFLIWAQTKQPQVREAAEACLSRFDVAPHRLPEPEPHATTA